MLANKAESLPKVSIESWRSPPLESHQKARQDKMKDHPPKELESHWHVSDANLENKRQRQNVVKLAQRTQTNA